MLSAEAVPVERPGTQLDAPMETVDEGAGCMVLPRQREIRVTSGGHNTIFGQQITHIRDLPPPARRLLDIVSRAVEVLDVRFGPFSRRGASPQFNLVLTPPRAADGIIEGRLTGPARIGGSQRLRIRVTPNRERATYLALVRLLMNEVR